MPAPPRRLKTRPGLLPPGLGSQTVKGTWLVGHARQARGVSESKFRALEKFPMRSSTKPSRHTSTALLLSLHGLRQAHELRLPPQRPSVRNRSAGPETYLRAYSATSAINGLPKRSRWNFAKGISVNAVAPAPSGLRQHRRQGHPVRPSRTQGRAIRSRT